MLRVIFLISTVLVRGLLVRLTRTLAAVLLKETFLTAGAFAISGFATVIAAGFGRAAATGAADFLVLALDFGAALLAPGLVLTVDFLATGMAATDV